eukprot:TRINITY_DN33785_c0_g1_i1.p1 TRINITY_DN33785_c0_g1~~TRINITY_DN33785_c0_g1_i1.p1  ORF type:complete len:185 (+),score=39.97 TRINITY_DN33785_c0_g1_i1:52-606(+)
MSCYEDRAKEIVSVMSEDVLRQVAEWAVGGVLRGGSDVPENIKGIVRRKEEEAAMLSRVRRKKEENDELERYLGLLRGKTGRAREQHEIRTPQPPPTASITITVKIQLPGLSDSHTVTIKRTKTTASLISAFSGALLTMYSLDITPLCPKLLSADGISCPPDAPLGLPPISANDGDTLTIVSGI